MGDSLDLHPTLSDRAIDHWRGLHLAIDDQGNSLTDIGRREPSERVRVLLVERYIYHGRASQLLGAERDRLE